VSTKWGKVHSLRTEELKIPTEKEELQRRLRKSFMEYGRQKMEIVFAGVLERIESGREIVDPIAYGLKILREQYEKLY
jgi:hypothetical protein